MLKNYFAAALRKLARNKLYAAISISGLAVGMRAPWPFFGAATAAWIIAVLTVTAHCYMVARTKPVSALRYE